jgi:hypothetical protein
MLLVVLCAALLRPATAAAAVSPRVACRTPLPEAAVTGSVLVQDGKLVFQPGAVAGAPLHALLAHAARGRFPCGGRQLAVAPCALLRTNACARRRRRRRAGRVCGFCAHGRQLWEAAHQDVARAQRPAAADGGGLA